MFAAYLALTLFVQCAFAKAEHGTLQTARRPIEVAERRTPQLTAMGVEHIRCSQWP